MTEATEAPDFVDPPALDPLAPPSLGPAFRADEARVRADIERLGLLEAARAWHKAGEITSAVLAVYTDMAAEKAARAATEARPAASAPSVPPTATQAPTPPPVAPTARTSLDQQLAARAATRAARATQGMLL